MSEKEKALSKFEQLLRLNVNDKCEKKKGDSGVELTYLSWAWAWGEFKKAYPEAIYTIFRNDNGLPYFGDERVGYMCYTSVTAGGETHEMWLPVMDAKNKAMRLEAYKYRTQYGEKTVAAMTMFDVNKTLMRCLVKNLAMFGLGLYIYAGEDLPEASEEPAEPARDAKKKKPTKNTAEPEKPAEAPQMTYMAMLKEMLKERGLTWKQYADETGAKPPKTEEEAKAICFALKDRE